MKRPATLPHLFCPAQLVATGLSLLSALALLPGCATPMALQSSSVPPVAPMQRTPIYGAPAAASQAGHVTLDAAPVRPAAVQPAHFTPTESDPEPTIRRVAHSQTTADCSTCFSPAEPRLPPFMMNRPPADLYPDEYLADGGDRDLPVHYQGSLRKGFDTEDTVAEYKDHDGDHHVKASNRVSVYAPRFGSVRVVEQASADIKISHAQKALEFSGAGQLDRSAGLHQAVKEDGTRGFDSRLRADGAEASVAQLHSEQTTRVVLSTKVDKGMQTRGMSGLQRLERLQGADFHEQLANAAQWNRRLYPMLSGATSQATETRSRITAQAVIGLEDERSEKSEIHIVKLADRETAEAGDTIRFTIRYINTGDYDLHEVRIVDNLTPRLQFVEDSVETDRAGGFAAEDNNEGSKILTFELDEPLPAHGSGAIHFEVTVQ